MGLDRGSLLDQTLVRILWAPFQVVARPSFGVCSKSLILARILLSQFNQNLPPSISHHSQYLTKFLIWSYLRCHVITLNLPSVRILSGQFSQELLYSLSAVHPLTPHPSLYIPAFLVVFRVQLHLSPLLQNPIAVIPIPIVIVLNEVCLTTLKSIRIIF